MSALLPWEPAKCRVPMWCAGSPAGYCDKPAFGHQYPQQYVDETGSYYGRLPYVVGHCCHAHGGPKEGAPIIFQDGLTEAGLPMYCAVMPGFVNLLESEAGFSGDPVLAASKLKSAIAKAGGAK